MTVTVDIDGVSEKELLEYSQAQRVTPAEMIALLVKRLYEQDDTESEIIACSKE